MPSNAIDPSQVQWDQPVAAAPPLGSALPVGGVGYDTTPTAGAIDASKVQWDAPAQTAVGGVQAAASGINAGAADLAGLPVDTARNVLELGKAGAGFVYHETTGNPIPDALQPSDTPDVGSSAWIKSKLNHIRVGTDVTEDTTANRFLHGAAEAVPSALAGNEAAPVRAAVAGAAAGAGQQGAAEAGGSSTTQAAVGLLAGAAAHRATVPRTTAPVSVPQEPITPTKFEPGDAPRMHIGGNSTAADQLRQGVPLPEITAPTPEGTESPALPDPEHNQRANTLRAIGLKEARESAITGDTKATGTDFQTGKVDGDIGDRMSGVIEKERAAQRNYAAQLADATGGTRGIDQSDLYNRGATIAKPIEQLSDHFDAKIKDAYAAADKKAGGTPVEMPATSDFLQNQRSQFLGTTEGKQLREGVQSRMRDLGLMDQDGAVQPATVRQAQQLKQYLNDQWSPRTSRLIGQLKGVIDDDVTKAAGSDIYANATATRALRSTLLDDPTGIAKLAAPDDRLGINRSVPLEQIPDYIQKLPVDQFAHVVKTLRDVPAEVRPAASAALNEIRSHFASSVEKAGNSTQGMWNAKGANEFMNKNHLRMAEVFSPEEMGRFKTLADAGNILKMDRTYPGAAAQGHNLMMSGALKSAQVIKKVAGVAGTVAGVAHGGAAGALEFGPGSHLAAAGVEHAAAKLGQRSLKAQVEKRIRKL